MQRGGQKDKVKKYMSGRGSSRGDWLVRAEWKIRIGGQRMD